MKTATRNKLNALKMRLHKNADPAEWYKFNNLYKRLKTEIGLRLFSEYIGIDSEKKPDEGTYLSMRKREERICEEIFNAVGKNEPQVLSVEQYLKARNMLDDMIPEPDEIVGIQREGWKRPSLAQLQEGGDKW